MARSNPERMSITAESVSSLDSKPSRTNSVISCIDVSGTNPLTNIYSVNETDKAILRRTGPNDLPSKVFQYSQWHELTKTEIYGDQLKAPRVRRGPSDKERDFYGVEDEDNKKVHHDLTGLDRKHHRDELEHWENAKVASFTRQDLHHGYQKSNLSRVLYRLRIVVYLNLNDNDIVTLQKHSFPKCEYINLDDNFMTSLNQLPSLPKVKYITARSNGISTLDGLNSLRSSPLEELCLLENPVSYKIGYRYRVFKMLPHLKALDGTLKTEEDSTAPETGEEFLYNSRGCVIS